MSQSSAFAIKPARMVNAEIWRHQISFVIQLFHYQSSFNSSDFLIKIKARNAPYVNTRIILYFKAIKLV